MSLYKRKGSPYWHYDFQIDGLRFRGSTRTTEKRVAKAVEARERNDGIKRGRLGQRLPISVNEAFGRYWNECAQHHANAVTEDYQLENLMRGLGKDTLLSEITDNEVAEYVARRRSHVSDASVNREVELLRRLFKRATAVWKRDTGQPPTWTVHRLEEAAERIRELSEAEEAALFAHLGDDLGALVRFCLLSGARLGNAIRLTWPQVDLNSAVVTFRVKSRKPGGKVQTLPLTNALLVLLANRRGLHPIYPFTYKCQKTRRLRRRGERYPFTKSGWRKQWSRALKAAGIEDFRFHDLRHTAATRTLRASGNMKAVQKMLGHSDITTTARYAHVMVDDVRAAMEAAARHNIPTTPPVRSLKALTKKG